MKVTISSVAAIAGLAAAAPHTLAPRAVNDGDILNYALTLEHLEATFYRQALNKYTEADFAAAGYDSTFYSNIKEVASDEATHVQFITKALEAAGIPHVKACTYSFPDTDVKSFLTVASVLEGVGVSAYLGAAAKIMSKDYLTDAGSILTVEARHSSYLRAAIKEVPFAQPFDNPLTLDEVYTLAAQFIKSCPSSNPKLPVKAFPTLTATSHDKTITTGSMVKLSAKLKKWGKGDIHAAFITVTGPVFVPVHKMKGGYEVKVPKGIAGQSYVVLTNSKKMVNDDTVVAGPAIVEVSA